MQGTTSVNGMSFHAFHGDMEVERELGQVFSVDISVAFEMAASDLSPSSEEAVKGAGIYDVAKEVILGTRYQSITKLGMRIAKELFTHFKSATEIEVCISRRPLFVAGDVKEMVADVYCERGDFELDD